MTNEIIFDLGEYGTVLVEPVDIPAETEEPEEGLVQAGMGETARAVGERIRVKAHEVMKLPLTGMAKLFLATLPESAENDLYQLDGFSVEFEVGLTTETGIDAGAVVKIVPNGGFKCTYSWKRKSEKT